MIQNLQYIHPLNRNAVEEISSYLSENPNVAKIIIFGSSITSQCHNDSDVDLYVELKDRYIAPTHEGRAKQQLIDRSFDFSFDLWTNYTVDVRLLFEIKEKGIVVYERE